MHRNIRTHWHTSYKDTNTSNRYDGYGFNRRCLLFLSIVLAYTTTKRKTDIQVGNRTAGSNIMSSRGYQPQYKQQLDAYRMELVNAMRDCRFTKINTDDSTYQEAVDALYLILPPEVKAQAALEIRDYEDFVPKHELERLQTMRPIDAHFAARKIEMKYTRSETDRMFSLIVDLLSKAGLLLSSAPRGVGKVGKKRVATEPEKKENA